MLQVLHSTKDEDFGEPSMWICLSGSGHEALLALVSLGVVSCGSHLFLFSLRLTCTLAAAVEELATTENWDDNFDCCIPEGSYQRLLVAIQFAWKSPFGERKRTSHSHGLFFEEPEELNVRSGTIQKNGRALW